MTVISLLQQLVRCASVTPQDEGALAVLEQALQQADFETHLVRFSEAGTPDIDNLFAKIGSGTPHLVFAGHTDVVPSGDVSSWTHPPFGAEIVDGKIYGRGTADMKGGVAASVAAVLNHLAKHGAPKGTISFLITGDEEGPAINGTLKLLAWARDKGERFDHCLLGEPTNPNFIGEMMKIGRRGSLTGHIRVHGTQGHVGYPHLADNPVPHLMRILTALKATPLDDGTAHFDASNLEITTFDVGNPASNVIPATAFARFNVRFNDIWTLDSLEAELRRRIGIVQGSARISVHFEKSNAVAFMTQPGTFTTLVSQAIAQETGHTPVLSTTGGTSDARFIKDYAQVVEFGLVGKTMHGIDEHVEVSDVEALTRIYERVLEAYFQ